jgi:hypothetical protein
MTARASSESSVRRRRTIWSSTKAFIGYHRALGFGLAHYLVGTPRHTAIFENLLSAADEEEVVERLRDQGVPAQELDAVHAEMSKEKGKQVPASDSDSTDDEAKESSKSSAPSSLKKTPASPQSFGSHATTESGPSAAATNSSVIGRSSQARSLCPFGLHLRDLR